MPRDFQPVNDTEAGTLEGRRARREIDSGSTTDGPQNDQVLASGPTVRRTQFTEEWTDLVFTPLAGEAGKVVRQLWNRCPPPHGPQPPQVSPQTTVQDNVPFPAAFQDAPPSAANPPPESTKSSRQGDLYLNGYSVRGFLYRRTAVRIEQRDRGETTWTRYDDENVQWTKAEVTNETHQGMPLIRWQPWRSVDCTLGTWEPFGMLVPGGEFYALLELEEGALVAGKTLPISAASKLPGALALATPLGVKYSSSKERLELVFLERGRKRERVVGKIEVRTASKKGKTPKRG